MRIDDELSSSGTERTSLITVGVFDGVHRGHRHLISRLVEEASARGSLSGVVTFRTHPAELLDPAFRPRYLTTLRERVRLLRDLGVDFVAPITFDHDLATLRARDFMSLLQQHLKAAGIVAGPDFAMGHRREGDVATLKNMGKDMGVSITVVQLLSDGGGAVRSTAIRELLAAGDVAAVNGLLGRRFVLEGKVVRGAGRGGPLGIPTANLDVPEGMALPGDGIYAAWAHIAEGATEPSRPRMAATSIGTRPTFDAGDRSVEAFVLDFEGDLYGREVRLEFVERLRDEEKYDSVEALLEQIDLDVARTRDILGRDSDTACG